MAISENKLRSLLAAMDANRVATLSADDARALCVRAGGAIVELLAAMGEGSAFVASASSRKTINAMEHPHFDMLPSGPDSAMPDAPAPMYRRVGWGELHKGRLIAFSHVFDADTRVVTSVYVNECDLEPDHA